MPERIWEAVTSETLEQRVRKWTPPDPDHKGNFELVRAGHQEATGRNTSCSPRGTSGCTSGPTEW